jgi:uncharacterized protein
LNKEALYWIKKLNLQKHPEGGYFVETYKSEKFINLPYYDGPHHSCTAIYYLLVAMQFSSFHRIKSDELWHFYTGNSLTLHIIERNRELNEVRLGSNIDNGESFQAVVKSESWFAASVSDDEDDSYTLVGCIVSPGFDYRHLELGNIETLTKRFPQYKSIIKQYTFSGTQK